MGDGNSKQPWWKIGATLILVAGALVSILEYCSAPSADVTAEVEYGQLQYPPGVRHLTSFMTKPYAYPDSAWNEFTYPTLVPDSSASTAVSQQVAEKMLGSLQRELLDEYDQKAYRLHRSIWVFTVRNEGDRAADSVVIRFPDAEYAAINRGTGPNEQGAVEDGAIELGALLPGTVAHVFVWARSNLKFADLTTEDISISHRNGRGEIDFERDVAEVFQWFDRYPMLALYLGGMGILAFVVFVIVPGVNKVAGLFDDGAGDMDGAEIDSQESDDPERDQ